MWSAVDRRRAPFWSPSDVCTEENVNSVQETNYKTCCWVSQVIIWNNTSYYFWCSGLQQSSTHWVPRTAEITHISMQTSSCNLDLQTAGPVKFLRRYVTMDQTCAYHFDPEMKRQSMQWKHPTSPRVVKFCKTTSATRLRRLYFETEELWWQTTSTCSKARISRVYTTLD